MIISAFGMEVGGTGVFAATCGAEISSEAQEEDINKNAQKIAEKRLEYLRGMAPDYTIQP